GRPGPAGRGPRVPAQRRPRSGPGGLRGRRLAAAGGGVERAGGVAADDPAPADREPAQGAVRGRAILHPLGPGGGREGPGAPDGADAPWGARAAVLALARHAAGGVGGTRLGPPAPVLLARRGGRPRPDPGHRPARPAPLHAARPAGGAQGGPRRPPPPPPDRAPPRAPGVRPWGAG